MGIIINKKRKIKAENAIKILEKHGTIVTTEEAQIILDLSYEFTRIAVAQRNRERSASNKTGN